MVKQYQGAKSGQKMTPTVEYLRQVGEMPERGWENTMESILLGFKEVAVGKVKLATENLDKRQRGGLSYEDAWNMTSIELTQCAEVISKSFFMKLMIFFNLTFYLFIRLIAEHSLLRNSMKPSKN